MKLFQTPGSSFQFPKDRAAPFSDEAVYARNFDDPYKFAPGNPDLMITGNGEFIAERMRRCAFADFDNEVEEVVAHSQNKNQ